MRLVNWNCGAGFHRKIKPLLALRPDVAVIQECAYLETLAVKAADFQPASALWTGNNRNRGLGVFSFGQYRLKPVGNTDNTITYALPVQVIGSSTFSLLALWSHYGRTPVRVADPGPTQRALNTYAELLKKPPAILAGDLNNHVRWDKPGKASNHANTVAVCAMHGLVSAYHVHNNLEHGKERHPTLYWRDRTQIGPKYHIDYAFISKRSVQLMQRVSIGSYQRWVATGLSDHVPLLIDFAPSFGRSS